MTPFDTGQRSVLQLTASAHARILGAPGTGKTTLITHMVTEWLETGTYAPGEVLVMAQHRRYASELRDRIERRVSVPVTGTFVRTATSLALVLCNEVQRAQGRDVLQLMMGARQDEVLQMALQKPAILQNAPFDTQALESIALRTELRDFWRVLDDFDVHPRDVQRIATEIHESTSASDYLLGQAQHWEFAAQVIECGIEIARAKYPNDRTASQIHAEARRALADADLSTLSGYIPKLVIVDHASELGEGALALCARLANVGTKFWMFGDPDSSTAAFHGEPARVLVSVHAELQRRGALPGAVRGDEQEIVLTQVHRHGAQIRAFVHDLSQRVGTGFGWQHRAACADEAAAGTVEFCTARTFSEHIGMIAFRLRHRHLGLHTSGEQIPWSQMAVICRSAEHATQIADSLEDLMVPTQTSTGGIVLGQHTLIQDMLRVLQDALGIEALSGSHIRELMTSQLGGLDPVALRRLDHALHLDERRRAHESGSEPLSLREVYAVVIEHPELIPDLAEGRALKRFARVLTESRSEHDRGATAREVLWAIWENSGLSKILADQANAGKGRQSALAHQHLDAVVELFFVFERHEEQASDVPITELISETLRSTVPQDSLARTSHRDAVFVTTPQGASTQEFEVVCIAGPQEGVWPNMRSRGSMVGAFGLQTFLRGDTPSPIHRQQTLHEELRLMVSACSRARSELLVVAREDEAEFPSPFFHLGAQYLVSDLPNTTLTVRGHLAAMRRRLQRDTNDIEARDALAYLAEHGVAGADAAEWYGIREPSTNAPLVDLSDPDATIRVSPSRIETVETCPLHWFTSSLASDRSNVTAQIGTLVHHALDTAVDGTEIELRTIIDEAWSQLEFDAPWLESQAKEWVYTMISGLTDYLTDASAAGRTLLASEAAFTVKLGQAIISGIADRIELVKHEDGTEHPVVIDLKTGRSFPALKEVEQHPQLLAYQLGLTEGEFSGDDADLAFERSAGAALLYVHPEATTKKLRYRLLQQSALDEEARQVFEKRVTEAVQLMAAPQFEAYVEHHCSDPNASGACHIHIIPAVSYE